MVANSLTKPLSGAPFRKFQNTIMRLDERLIGIYKTKYKNAKNAYHNRLGV